MHQKWFRTLLRRRFTVIILLLIQIGFFICSLFLSSQVSDTLNVVLKILSFAAILNVISKKDKGAYKMMWVLVRNFFHFRSSKIRMEYVSVIDRETVRVSSTVTVREKIHLFVSQKKAKKSRNQAISNGF